MDGSFSTDAMSRPGAAAPATAPASSSATFEPQSDELPVRRPSQPSAILQALCEPVTLTLLVTLLSSVLFVLFPIIDRATSAVFHHPVDGFVAAADPALRALRKSSSWVMGGLLVAVVVVLVAGLVNRGATGPDVRRPLCLLLAFVVGPGLVVNGLLKSFWGRARPVNVTEFGGQDPFTSAWAFSPACASNCSFTSGEGASAAWMALVLLLVPAQWRALGAILVIPYAFMLSMNRIAFGGHFLSDVVLSWCLTAVVTALIWRWLETVSVRKRSWPVQVLWGVGRSIKVGT